MEEVTNQALFLAQTAVPETMQKLREKRGAEEVNRFSFLTAVAAPPVLGNRPLLRWAPSPCVPKLGKAFERPLNAGDLSERFR